MMTHETKQVTAITILLLMLVIAATSLFFVSSIAKASSLDDEMKQELAKHPSEHFICTAMDLYCVKGFWKKDKTAAENETALRLLLDAMLAADQETAAPSQ